MEHLVTIEQVRTDNSTKPAWETPELVVDDIVAATLFGIGFGGDGSTGS